MLTHHADSSLEAQCQCPAVGHETGYDEDVTMITHQVGSSFETEHEARCDGDVHPKGTDGPLETTHTDEAASSESSEANVEPGQEASDREDSESDAPYTPELDIVLCLGRVGRRRAMLGACAPDPGADLLAAVATGGTPRRMGVYGSSAGMTRDAMWHSARRLRMLSKTSTEINTALVQSGLR